MQPPDPQHLGGAHAKEKETKEETLCKKSRA